MKKGLLYGLLAAGIILVATGVCLIFFLSDRTAPETRVVFPEGSPVIALDDTQLGLDVVERLHVYEDGKVLYYLGRPGMSPEIGPVAISREWRLDNQELASLIDLVKNKYTDLQDNYVFPEIKENEQDIAEIDQEITLSINIDDMVKQVKAQGYYLAYSSYIGPHQDIPEPLNELYQALNAIATNYEKEYVQAVDSSHDTISDVLEITRYSSGDTVTMKGDDERFTNIYTILLNSVVQKVTHKTGTSIIDGQTVIAAVTIPYTIQYILTFRPVNYSEVTFSYSSGTIWYESAANIYQVTSSTKLGDLLDEIMQ